MGGKIIKSRLVLAIFAIAVTVPVLMGPRGGCKDAKNSLKFSHGRHAKKGISDCGNCHGRENEPRPAGKQDCAKCHDFDMENPDKACLECHLDDNYEEAGEDIKAARQGFSDVIFAHKSHAEGVGLNCNDCHGGILKTDGLRTNKIPRMADCRKCHRKGKIESRECDMCHETIRENVEPENHRTAWVGTHGLASSSPAARCDLCHSASSCRDCHLDTMPEDHTDQWRKQGHRVSARYDQARCRECHFDDVCFACHQSMAPADHSPGWGAPSNQHCNQCHIPLGATSCGSCHIMLPPGQFHRN